MRNKRSFSVASILLHLLVVLLIGGCTFVSLRSDADTVQSIEESAAADCDELGSTQVEVLHELGVFARTPTKINDELDILARNAAVDLGGNAVVPSGPTVSGKRPYRILRCP